MCSDLITNNTRSMLCPVMLSISWPNVRCLIKNGRCKWGMAIWPQSLLGWHEHRLFFLLLLFFSSFFFFKKKKKSNRSLFWWIQITPKLLLFIRRSIAYTDWSMDMCVHWLVQFPLQRCNVYILPVFDACSFIDLSSCTYLSDYLLCTHVENLAKWGCSFWLFFCVLKPLCGL